jgi:hypothetical protein
MTSVMGCRWSIAMIWAEYFLRRSPSLPGTTCKSYFTSSIHYFQKALSFWKRDILLTG